MKYNEFKRIMKDLHYYATAGVPPEGIEVFSEDEQDWFIAGYTGALHNIHAKSDMNYVMPTLSEKNQETFFKAYYQGIQNALQKLKKASVERYHDEETKQDGAE